MDAAPSEVIVKTDGEYVRVSPRRNEKGEWELDLHYSLGISLGCVPTQQIDSTLSEQEREDQGNTTGSMWQDEETERTFHGKMWSNLFARGFGSNGQLRDIESELELPVPSW